MKLPKEITPCPIIGAVFVIRFETKLPSGVFFGILYNTIKEQYPVVKNQSIFQHPNNSHQENENNKFIFETHISDNLFTVHLRDNYIAIHSPKKYIGWEKFSERIYSLLNEVEKLNTPIKIQHFGLRYINFFNQDIFDNINLSLNLRNNKIKKEPTIIKVELGDGNIKHYLQVANNTVLNNKITGSFIDIETRYIKDLGNIPTSSYKDCIEDLHTQEKTLFFDLLTKDFLNSFNPKY